MFAHRIVGPVLCLILFKLIKFWYSFESNSFISSGVTVCPLLKNETENSRNYVTPIYAVFLRYFYSKVEHTSEFETKEKNLEHLETFRMSSFMEMVCCSAGNCDFECQPLDRALVENIDTLLKRPNGYIFTFKFIVSYFSKGWTNRNNKSCQNEKKIDRNRTFEFFIAQFNGLLSKQFEFIRWLYASVISHCISEYINILKSTHMRFSFFDRFLNFIMKFVQSEIPWIWFEICALKLNWF